MKRRFLTPAWIAIALSSMLALTGVLYGLHCLEQFLIRDTRFALNLPGAADASGEESLEVSGAAHVSPRAIEAVFSDDFGKSAYLVPLSDRRASLRTVAWIKDASVARFWPNRVLVGVTERKPVAYLSSDTSRRPSIDRPPFDQPTVDEDGALLPPVEDHFTLPVLVGVRVTDSAGVRRDRVQRMLRLMKDLGDAGHAVVQVDLSDTDNIRVNEPFEGRMVTLLLGDRNFALRHQNFVRYFAEIRKKMAGATVLDLRVEDRITVVPPSGIPASGAEQAVTD